MSIPSDMYKLGKSATAITVNNNPNAKNFMNKTKDSIRKQFELILTFLVLISLFFLQCLTLHFAVDWVRITCIFGAMFWCSLIVSRAMFKSGRINGENTDLFLKSQNKYMTSANRLTPAEHRQLDKFCEWLHAEDLANARKDLLSKCGVEYEEYKKKRYFTLNDKQVKELKDLSEWQKKIIIEANHLNFVKISSEELLNETAQKRNVNYHYINKSLDHEEKKALCSNILSAIVVALPFAFLAIELAQDFSWHSVFWYVVQICFVFIKSIPAYFRGFNMVKSKGVLRLNQKWHILCIFEEWYKENFVDKETKTTQKEKEQKIQKKDELVPDIIHLPSTLGVQNDS